MQKFMVFSWSRFVRTIFMISIVPVLLTLATVSRNEFNVGLAAVWVVFLSAITFMALGWARLRRESLLKPIAVTDLGRALSILIGPVVPAAVWFFLTLACCIGIAVVWGLHGRAA